MGGTFPVSIFLKVIFTLFCLCMWGFCLHICTSVHQKRESDPIGLQFYKLGNCHVGAGNLNSGSLEEKPVLLNAESSLQP